MRSRGFVAVAAVATVVACSGPTAAPPVAARYRWVEPPADVALVNMQPLTVETAVPISDDFVAPSDVWTPDAQAVLSLDPASLPPRPRAVPVALRPVAAATLAALPAGAEAYGNAYEVEVGDGTDGSTSPTGRLYLTTPWRPKGMARSVDGRAWTCVPLEVSSDGRAVTTFRGGGYYVATTDACR